MTALENAPNSQENFGPSESYFSRIGAGAALAGLVIYGTALVLHPGTPPHETEAAFADYAVELNWGFIHLGELLGILLMSVTGLALAWRLRRGIAGVWALLGGAAMMMFASVYAIFTAVDGVALGIMVERWALAAPERQELLYETAFAVRQIEAGLFGLQWLMFGLATGLFGLAFFASAGTPFRLGGKSGMGWLSVVASAGALAFGVVQAQTGFTALSMAFQTGIYVGVVWLIAVGIFLYRYPEQSGTLESATQSNTYQVAQPNT